jgi:hypothetical protein
VFDVLAGRPEAEANASGGKERGQGARSDAHFWSSPAGAPLVKITYNTRACAMLFDEKSAPGFGDFVATQMDRLFADYTAARASKGNAPEASESHKPGKGDRRPAKGV